MRKVISQTFMSLDGVMQSPGAPKEDPSGGFEYGGWHAAYHDDDVLATIGETFKAPFDLLLGRKTYDIFAAHWPRIAADPSLVNGDEFTLGIAKKFDQITKYVATHSPATLEWKNSQALSNDVAAAVRQLKQGSGPNLLTQGSSDLLQTLMANDLVDELRLFIYPIVLGRGKRLFDRGTFSGAFKVTKSETSPTGVLIAHYARDGEIKTASFGLEDRKDGPKGDETRHRQRA